MALTDPLIGRMLGDYRVIDILGRGGMARVYRGYDPKLERYAAIKVIDSALLSNQESEDEYRARFRREARAIARLNHPNIVSIFQYGEVDALYYMAMNFIEGRDLGQILKEYATYSQRIPVEQVLRIVSDTASALDYAHSGGVIHRDVKPSNIMVTPEGRAILTDFGLALSVPEGSIGNTFGSAHYIAPEQAVSSAQAVPQSDLYSLAIVIYQMLTGRVPFDDPSAMSVALRHISDLPPPLRNFASEIPAGVEQVVLKALEKDVKRRYPDGQTMVQALEAAYAPFLGYSLSRPTGTTPLLRRISTDEIKVTPGQFAPVENPTWSESVPLQARSTDTSSRASLLLARAESLTSRPGSTKPKPETRQASPLRLIAVILLLVAIAAAALFVLTNTPPNNLGGGDGTAVVIGADQTDEVTAVPTDAPPTETPLPDTPTLASPTTETPSTPTDIPTETPVRPPTVTITPEGFVVPDSISSETPTLSPGAPIVLTYDTFALVLQNRSSELVNISGISFVRLNQLGTPITFSVSDWDPVSRNGSYFMPSGGCYHIWLISQEFQGIPAQCSARFGWEAVGTNRQFWISSEPGATFEVQRAGSVLATCPTNAGQCSFTP